LHLCPVFEMIATFVLREGMIITALERSAPMSNAQDSLTTQEFAHKAGVSPGTVSKWLRNGTIQGEKRSGKWAIAASELAKLTESKENPIQNRPAGAVASQPDPALKPASPKSYSIQEFSDMTYLTEYGVRLWLKQGRLDGVEDAHGNLRVNAANLEKPLVKRLVRS
jgi:transcriptional regulator with XRE-family HTH domain